MKKDGKHYGLYAGGAFFFLIWTIIFWGTSISYSFTLGETYTSKNWQEINHIAPPFLVNWVKKGDFTLRTGEVNFDFELEKDFLSQSRNNLGRFDINENGFIVEKKTREPPGFIYGLPFSGISSRDQKAAAKIMANNQYGLFRFGAIFQPYALIFAGNEGKEREITVVGARLFYQGRPEGPLQNKDNLLYQYTTRVVSPMDMKGTIQLFWEYNDERLGTCYTYASMLRRISRATPNTRSNSFLGCDMCPDDSDLWHGKNNRFDWKLIGEKEILCAFPSPDKIEIKDLPDGTVKMEPKKMQHGYDCSSWNGAPWAPLNMIWSPRPVWIVEGIPKDPDYNYGKQLFYVDSHTYTIWFKEVYNRSGEYWKGLFAVQSFQVAPSGRTNLLRPDSFMAVDEDKQHASLAGILDSAGGVSIKLYCPESVIGPREFTVEAAQQMTK